MRIYRFLTTAIGGVLLAGISQASFASCVASAPTCNPGVNVIPGLADPTAPVSIYSSNPYGHLKTVGYKNSPNVNIMRVYGQRPTVALADFPSQYSGGCKPGSTVYCRAPQAQPVQVQMAPPPMISAPMPAPLPAPRITVGSGYNPANFASRQYGSTNFVPGIAHVPTSIIDRSPITHIDGIPQPRIGSVTTMAMSRGYQGMSIPAPRPAFPPMGGRVIGQVNAGSFTYQPPGGGAYWEKTSGPTMVDGLPATQILCRREAPRPAPITVNVVRPVIGVPQPVPTPVPVQVGCAPTPMPVPGIAPVTGKRLYGSRWTY